MGPVQTLMNSILGAAAVTAVGSKMAIRADQKAKEAQEAAAASLATAQAEKMAINDIVKGGVPNAAEK